ncbi:MAG: recombinase family protein [Firmicutes bacterium]|nr:recombinase family protein [Bacillota bacterium]
MATQKIKVTHLSRNAYLYIRQSTLRQVYENTESTKRQYALKQQAVSLGWTLESIITIDSDLGQSGVTTAERTGFQKLVAEVGMGHAGIVIGLEVSRLSRSSTDWSRLLEICAITDTLIMDEDGVYDTNDFNDRLLLGLKGTMSEAELHFLQARMRGGLMNKAKRGELRISLPIGYIYNDNGQIVFDPDVQVRQAINLFFQTFRRVGSVWGTVREFNKQGFKFPLRAHKGFKKGELQWVQLVNSTTLRILHNPMYAGIYCYGRTQVQRTIHGKKTLKMEKEDWHTFIPGSHPGYITIEDYERNLKILYDNAHPRGEDGRKSPPREGPALLQGIVICGNCGKKMTVQYHDERSKLIPIYVCQKRCIEYGDKICQTVKGDIIDREISKMLIEMVTPLAVEASLEVQKELNLRKLEVDRYYKQQVERARYEMELARRRYMNVDPDNRLVAVELEAEWNKKLREMEQAQEVYEKQCQTQVQAVNEDIRSDMLDMVAKFPEIWNNRSVPNREKKRIVRCLIEDVTIQSINEIILSIRFKGGTSKVINIPKPPHIWKTWVTSPDVIKGIDYLTDYCTSGEVADILNEKGVKSGQGKKFSSRIVERIIRNYNLKNRYTRLRESGLLTLPEKMAELGVSQREIQRLRENGQLNYHRYCGRLNYLYEPERF